ncbi:MAG TPA: AAA family ATPase [Candidatus Saccharimonadales bacterium]|nr:AAA family ATPase [Candidatus Saccharimonadales bacterium]
MGKYLITGRGGSGKSAICVELQKRGFPAFDTDRIPGFCRWEDRKTGELTVVDPKGYIDFKKISWAWQDDVLQMLFKSNKDMILCGSSSNQADYYSLFDKIFVLVLDEKTHAHRLKTRDFDYGKNPKLQREIIARQQTFAKKMIDDGATPIDVTQPIEKVVDELLSLCEIPANVTQRPKK